MSGPQQQQQQLSRDISRGTAITISTEIMVAAIVFFFMIVVFVVALHLYAKRRWGTAFDSARRSRLVFASNQDPTTVPRRGLDPAVILSLPVSVYRAEDFKVEGAGGGGLECAVCLSELADGEKVRLLPNCKHGFHLECIDMWFHSHSTCPLCRRPVGPELEAGGEGAIPTRAADGYPTESPNLPTNVLFWGTQDQVSTATLSQEAASSASSSSSSSTGKLEGALVIEIPRRAVVEGFSSPHSALPSSTFPTEAVKSPANAMTPTPNRLRSLRRLLSREKRVVASSCSPRGGGGDIEQGIVPKTPTNS